MKKITIILFSLLLLAGCNSTTVKHNTELEISIQKAIQEAIKKGDDEKIDLHSLTNFTWDKAFKFEPYTPQESIDKQLGIHFKDPSNIDMRDDISLLVFIQDKKVIQYAEIKLNYAYISFGKKEILTPSDANIEIRKRK